MLLNTRTYNIDQTKPDAITYAGPAHTFSRKDIFQMSRVMPKPTATFAGVARPAAKRVLSVVVNATTGARADSILNISGSMPVGMADADIDAILADGAAFLGSQDAKDLFKKLDVN